MKNSSPMDQTTPNVSFGPVLVISIWVFPVAYFVGGLPSFVVGIMIVVLPGMPSKGWQCGKARQGEEDSHPGRV